MVKMPKLYKSSFVSRYVAIAAQPEFNSTCVLLPSSL